MMTQGDIIKRVSAIYSMRDDSEAAHSEQDKLLIEVLRAIADGKCSDPAACAAQALVVLTIEFDRWYA